MIGASRLITGSRIGLATRAEIHFTPTRIGVLDPGGAEMAGLTSAPITVETMLLTCSQPLLFEARNQFGWVDDAACTVGSVGETNDLSS